MKLVDKIRAWAWTTPSLEFWCRLGCQFMHVVFKGLRPRMWCEHGGPCVQGCRDDAEQWKCPACGLEFDNELMLDDHVEEYHGSYEQARKGTEAKNET